MSAAIRFTGDWPEVRRGLDPAALERRLKVGVARANEKISRQGVRDVRASIKGRAYAPNTEITATLKGSSTPLVSTGQLFQSITFAAPSWNVAQIGILRVVGAERLNLALALHEGFSFRPTAKQRALLAIKLRATEGTVGRDAQGRYRRRGPAPRMSRGTGIWTIPARPYLARPLGAPAFAAFALRTWSEAVRVAFRSRR